MPNIKSAEKRVEVSRKRNLANRSKKSRLQTALKKFDAAINARNTALAEQLLPETFSIIDKTCADGVIHKNNAARKKSHCSEMLYKLKNNLLPQKPEKVKKKAAKAEPVLKTETDEPSKTRSELKNDKVKAGLAGKDARRDKRAEKADKKAEKRAEKAEQKEKEKAKTAKDKKAK